MSYRQKVWVDQHSVGHVGDGHRDISGQPFDPYTAPVIHSNMFVRESGRILQSVTG